MSNIRKEANQNLKSKLITASSNMLTVVATLANSKVEAEEAVAKE